MKLENKSGERKRKKKDGERERQTEKGEKREREPCKTTANVMVSFFVKHQLTFA